MWTINCEGLNTGRVQVFLEEVESRKHEIAEIGDGVYLYSVTIAHRNQWFCLPFDESLIPQGQRFYLHKLEIRVAILFENK